LKPLRLVIYMLSKTSFWNFCGPSKPLWSAAAGCSRRRRKNYPIIGPSHPRRHKWYTSSSSYQECVVIGTLSPTLLLSSEYGTGISGRRHPEELPTGSRGSPVGTWRLVYFSGVGWGYTQVSSLTVPRHRN